MKVSYRWLIGAFAALFIFLQSYSVAHAASYGDAPHDHDGIACAVTVLGDDESVILPVPPVFDTLTVEATETIYPEFSSTVYIRPQTRAPPPRGPPPAI